MSKPKESQYMFDKSTYRMTLSWTRERFEEFCKNLYIRGFNDGKESVRGIDLEELLQSAKNVDGIGKKRSEELQKEFNRAIVEKGRRMNNE